MAAKPWLRDYFKRLAEYLENNEIPNERALSATVELPIKGWNKVRTLLEALEYSNHYVHPQYPIQLGTSKPRVDFLLSEDPKRKAPNSWMLDLKKPGESCDRDKYVKQIQSYLGQEKVPLGVLFNGKWALAYVNPDHEFVNDLFKSITEMELAETPALDLRNYPVIKVSMRSDDTRDMVRFFQMLRFEGGMPDIKELCHKLAGDYIKRIRSEAKTINRAVTIKATVKRVLQNPDEKILEFIIANSPELSKQRVSPKEILEVWITMTKIS